MIGPHRRVGSRSLFLLLLAGTASAQTVIGISAETQRVESLVVVRSSGLAVGDELTRDNLAAAVRRVFATGLFAEVAADTELVADGVRIRFRVREHPRLRPRGVNFVGNHKVRTRELSSNIAATDRILLTDRQIFDWSRKVTDLYRDRGYFLVKLTNQRSPPDTAGLAELTFFIEEGDRVRLREIRLNGAKSVSVRSLRRRLKNKTYLWPFRKGLFNDEEFKKDLERITDLYKEKGYLDAKVLNYELRPDSGLVEIDVSEGMKYYLGDVRFEGESLFARDELSAALRIRPGAVYNQKRVQQSLTDIQGLYSEQGYIYATVVPTDSIRRDTVDMAIRIAEGMPARVRLVNVEGNDRTREKVIRREIVSMPGSTFKRSEVIRSQQNVFNLGFFEDIQLDYKRVSDTTPDIDLTYRVKEKFAGTIGAGVSYSGSDGIVGYVELTQPNLFGRAQQLHVKFEKGGSKQNFELGFTEPWLFDTPTSAGITLFHLTTNYDNYDRRDRGGELSGSRPLPLDYTRGYVTFRVGDALISNSTRSDVKNDSAPKLTIASTFRFTRDSRDYVFNPSAGSFHSYSLELAGGILGGQVHYNKHILETNMYWPLFWKFVLRGRARFGYVSGYTRRDTVPIYSRFYPGGTGEDGVRGYPDRSLGIRSGGYGTGGRSEALFSLEYRLKLSRGLTALAFLDAGNAWESLTRVNLSQLKRGVGAGVRLEIPMLGWLGFDLGYGFDQDQPGTAKLQPHFQIGTGIPTGF
jgi:outer membrane protein insertion porin family